MKKLYLSLLALFLASQLHAQKFELSFQANSGLFHYSGNSASSTSVIIQNGTTPKQNYTNNPYGNKNAFSYGADVQAQYVSKGGFITGIQAGYNILRSKTNITSVFPLEFELEESVLNPLYYAPFNPSLPAKGSTILQDQFINLNPYIGYRIKTKKINIDLMPGIDIGFGINSYDKGKATTTDGTVYETDYKEVKPLTDVRLKFGAAVLYKKWGVTASFAHGLTNYTKNLLNDSPIVYKAQSELLRFGISYRIF
ncbi:outer membrane protein with beta-barrel domain [Mucilaginibacter frigoritolerans]|uniref:Outer membrane protein with beta-barrel domain n=1 Tax=Mucilaginibacter frigoritolerans TaxID=652788 RepID=A0A562TQQ1_9SPHI|nr:outer membrane beta-barrel protein [Mucilaginibacter frigoritolerans]TWI95931.1 outer membrane protein with beta-barrel domain [Mucilaginibacter frigoritolerans]